MKGPTEAQGSVIRVLMHLRFPGAFGVPEQTLPVRLTLRDGFARTADQARRKILDLVRRGQAFALDVVENPEPWSVEPERVVLVATWEEEEGPVL